MSIHVRVDPTNPGHFFACCGLLELANRLWGNVEGAFSSSKTEFTLIRTGNASADDADELLHQFAFSAISSSMSEQQIARLKGLLNKSKTSLTDEDRAEKQLLSSLWQRERIRFHAPFDLCIDWWTDDYANGSSLKTWAGKQFILDLVRNMQAAIRAWPRVPSIHWLFQTTDDGSLPLYFDATIGSQSSSLDVGFSMDALGMRGRTRPIIELIAFVGLQRFRPSSDDGLFSYTLWVESLPPVLAAVACCGHLPLQNARAYDFRLLYRTQYLKSFLTAKPKGT